MKPTATAHSVLSEAREEITRRDRIILEQQALIDVMATKLEWAIPDQNKALKAHDKEVRATAFDCAAIAIEAFGERLQLDMGVANYLDCEAELRRMAQEERKKK